MLDKLGMNGVEWSGVEPVPFSMMPARPDPLQPQRAAQEGVGLAEQVGARVGIVELVRQA